MEEKDEKDASLFSTIKDKILPVIALLTFIWGIYTWTMTTFAQARDLKMLQQTVSCMSLNDQYKSVRDRVWALEGKYGETPCNNIKMSKAEKIEYKQLIDEKIQLNNLLEECSKANK